MIPSRTTLEGGRSPGDDPFLGDDGPPWWLSLVLLLGAVVLAAVFLRWAVTALWDDSPAREDQGAALGTTIEAEQAPPQPARASPSPPPGAVGWSAPPKLPRQARRLPTADDAPDRPTAGEAPAPLGLSTTRVFGRASTSADGRSFGARRRALLVEAEHLLHSLPPAEASSPEQRRDRRALEQWIREMDLPVR